MKIYEIATAKPKKLYHLTSVRALLSMLKTGIRAGTSLATNKKSGFFSMMIGPGAVMLTLDGRKVPYESFKNPDGAKELAFLGRHSEEYEVRTLGVVHPRNALIKVTLLDGETNPKGSNHYSQDDLDKLIKSLSELGVDFQVVSKRKDLF